MVRGTVSILACASQPWFGVLDFFSGGFFRFYRDIFMCSFIKLCREFREFHYHCSNVFLGGFESDHG